jgi:hypothetical protein
LKEIRPDELHKAALDHPVVFEGVAGGKRVRERRRPATEA